MAVTIPPREAGEDPPEIEVGSDSELSAGEMRLYSFYAPSIAAGPTYKIQATQTITASTPIVVPDPSPQEFTIFAPRVKLEPGDIHSFFPSPHHTAAGRTLPHVVFTDPHLPWERQAVPTLDGATKNRVPWLAVIPFEPEELRLTKEQLAVGGLFGQKVEMHQSDTMAVRMTAGQAAGGDNPVKLSFPKPLQNAKDGIAMDTMLDMIFVDPKLAYALLGAEKTPDQAFQKGPDLEKYKYFAHVRRVDMSGGAGPKGKEGGIYSVVLSHRTGPWDIKGPKTVVVHLVALDGITDIELTDPASQEAQLPENKVGLISLHSWTYTCLPSGGPDIVDAMIKLGAQSEQMFRLPVVEICPPGATQEVFDTMNDRRKAGYVLLRHRLPTGEPTVSFYRSPLTPMPVAQIEPPDWPAQSNSGTDYQILDRKMGVMDISYSAAFQLGKALAIADAPFHACLARIRGALHEAAQGAAENEVYEANNRYWGVADVVGPDAMNQMSHCQKQLEKGPVVGDLTWARRWSKVVLDDKETKKDMENKVKGQYVGSHLSRVMEMLASTKIPAPSPETPPPMTPLDESGKPYSTDWGNIAKWLMDSLLLSNIPAHYLIPDPSLLPPESLRFFHIDPIWLDCFIDGALSLANHLDGDDDMIRQAIKTAFNRYLSTPLGSGSGPRALRPQIARCGFFIRSKVIEAFTDIKVSATWPSDAQRPAQVLDVIWSGLMDKDLLFCLLDRLPDDPALECISITQPPHQQCFCLGESFDGDPLVVKFQVKKMPKPDPSTGAWDSFPPLTWENKDPAESQIYDWDTRVIRVASMRDVMDDKLKSLAGYAVEWELTSAVMGLQLNDNTYYLGMGNQKAKSGAEWIQSIRKISVVPKEEKTPNPALKVNRRGAGGK